jgi:hypothetical protein
VVREGVRDIEMGMVGSVSWRDMNGKCMLDSMVDEYSGER